MALIICSTCDKSWEENTHRLDGRKCKTCRGKDCNHKWVNMEDGSLDKFCVRCSKKAMQAELSLKDLPLIPNDIRVAPDSLLRDKILESMMVPKELLTRNSNLEMESNYESFAKMWGLTPPGN